MLAQSRNLFAQSAAVVAFCCLISISPPLAHAQTGAEEAQSLAMVPEDAAVYGVTLNNKDVFDAVVNSKAYAKIAEMDDVKPLLEMAKAQWEETTADPAMKGIIQSLLDGMSEEVFFYMDSSYSRLMKVYQQANMQGSLLAAAQGGGWCR